MRIDEIDDAFSICREHLAASGALGADIDWFLARYILVRIRANFEERIRALLSEPLAETADEYARRLAYIGMNGIARGSRTSHIANTLKRIDSRLQDEFQRRVSNTEKEDSFNLIAVNINLAAHSTGQGYALDITLDELSRHYEAAHLVLDDLRDSISAWRADGGGA